MGIVAEIAAVGPPEEEEIEHPPDPADLAPSNEQDPSMPPRRRRVQVTEAGAQATDEWDKPDWTRFDLGRALKLLRTGSDGDVKRVLQRLHIRNSHQPAAQLSVLLQAAGMSARVLKFVEPVERMSHMPHVGAPWTEISGGYNIVHPV